MRISDIQNSLEKLRSEQGNRSVLSIWVYDEQIEIFYETSTGESSTFVDNVEYEDE